MLTEVRTIDRTELYLADELFLCGSAAEVTPIIKLDRFTVGLGKIGELTQSLMHNYHLIADGSKKNNNNWLTSVWNDK